MGILASKGVLWGGGGGLGPTYVHSNVFASYLV